VKVLLDTNAYTAFRKGEHAVRRCIGRAEVVLFSAVVAGELLFGFRYGSRTEVNTRELEAFLADPRVTLVDVGLVTADRFGMVATALRRAGTPIPTNDIWIAAHAMEHGAYLVSYDQHFERVPGLAWIDPAR